VHPRARVRGQGCRLPALSLASVDALAPIAGEFHPTPYARARAIGTSPTTHTPGNAHGFTLLSRGRGEWRGDSGKRGALMLNAEFLGAVTRACGAYRSGTLTAKRGAVRQKVSRS
jgi:hypothetical protein